MSTLVLGVEASQCVCMHVFTRVQAVQSVGNLGLQLGHGKEQWMAPLHPVILRSVASVKDFLDKLIDIDHDNGEPPPALCTRRGGQTGAWTRGDHVLRIGKGHSFNEDLMQPILLDQIRCLFFRIVLCYRAVVHYC